MTAQITIRRPHSGRLRTHIPLHLYVDLDDKGELTENNLLSINDVQPGYHSLRLVQKSWRGEVRSSIVKIKVADGDKLLLEGGFNLIYGLWLKKL